jgi:hypothetical protein
MANNSDAFEIRIYIIHMCDGHKPDNKWKCLSKKGKQIQNKYINIFGSRDFRVQIENAE